VEVKSSPLVAAKSAPLVAAKSAPLVAAKSAPLVAALSGLGYAVFLVWFSGLPPYAPLAGFDPVIGLVAASMLAGLVLVWSARAIARTPCVMAGTNTLAIIILAGVGMRLLMLASEPILEQDFLRYLWDGGLTANGINPYLYSPAEIFSPTKGLSGPAPNAVQDLARQANGLVESITYPDLRTIYPPLAQLAFAVAHWLDPWGLTGWRVVVLFSDGATLCILIVLLRLLKRNSVWVALYWLNPLVLKELHNSAHMEAILLPFLLAAVLVAIHRKPMWAVTALAGAVAIKFWPIVLLPIILAATQKRPAVLIMATALFLALTMALLAPMVWPMILGGWTSDYGLIAYAGQWQTFSATFGLIAFFATPEGARVIVAMLISALGFWMAWRVWADEMLAITATTILTATLYLLSPTGYPWYALWFMPFLVLSSNPALMLLTVTLPLYNLRFLTPFADFESTLAWLAVGPTLGWLAMRYWRGRTA